MGRSDGTAWRTLVMRWSRVMAAGGIMGVGLGGASVTSAQVTAKSTVATSAVVPTIDTGAFAPGNKEFSRYEPWMCVAAVRQAAEVARRSLAAQYSFLLLRDTAPERDTLPQDAIVLAQRCGERFTVTATAPIDLSVLFTLALQAGNEGQARAVVERRLAMAPDAKARQRILAEEAEGYVAAAPARLAEAGWAAAKADTLAHAEHTNSLPAHLPLLTAASNAFDRPRMVREARRLIALGRTLDFQAIQYDDVPLIEAWAAVLTVAFFERPDSVLILALQAKEDLARFPIGPDFPNGIVYFAPQLFDFKNASIESTRDFLIPFNPQKYTGANALPPVTAPYWYPGKPATWPPRGHVSLVLYGGWVMTCARSDWNLLLFPMSRRQCAPLHTYLRAWTETHATEGFALTLVERTSGEAVRSVPLSEQAEADSVNWYYRTYLELSGATVAVVPRALIRKAPLEADGRRWTADTTAFGLYLKDDNQGGQSNGLAMLYDRDGRLLYAGALQHALLHALIVRALAAPAAAPSGTAEHSGAGGGGQ